MARIYQDNSDSLTIGEGVANQSTLKSSDTLPVAEANAKVSGKVASDSLTIVESVANSSGARVSDAQTITEAQAKVAEFYRDYSDAESIVEAIQKAIKPVLQDSTSFSSSISKIVHGVNGVGNVFKLTDVFDTQVFAEQIVKRANLGRTDTLAIAEAIALAIGAGLTTTLGVAEAKVVNFVKSLSTSIAISASSLAYDVQDEVWWGMIKYRTCCHGGL